MRRAWALRFAAGRKSGRDAYRPAVEELTPRIVPAFTFAAAQTFAVGATPIDVALADFNGDGKTDAAVLNSDGNTVSVLLNTTPTGAATPTFAAQQTFAAGTKPASIAVADFNGDGKPDLAIADFGSDRVVTVLLNTTPTGAAVPTFAEPQALAIGDIPGAVAAADFNGDGKLDLAVTDLTNNSVLLLRNTTATGATTVSFAAAQSFATGANPILAATGDLNGDGRPDLAVVNYDDNTVSVLLDKTTTGSAAFNFSAQKAFAVGTGPLTVAIADLNGDGKADLAVANSLDNTVSVLLNTAVVGAAAPAFTAQQIFAVGGQPQVVTAGDLDGDGRPDLAVSNFDDKTVSVLRNTTPAGAAAASFAPQQTVAVGGQPVPVAIADFNADGRQDLFVGNSADQTASVLLAPVPVPAVSAATAVGQFGNQGVWQYSHSLGTWIQLTGANATLLGTDAQGDVVGEFPGYGVWLYQPSAGWQQINGIDVSALAMGAGGAVAADFPGYGVGEYLPSSGWRLLTPSNATLVAIDAAGAVAASFPGYGVWKVVLGGGWQQLRAADATLLAMNAQGQIAANFQATGVEIYAAGAWKLLDGVQATALAIDNQGDVAATFQGFGVGEFFAAGGAQLLTGAAAALLTGGDTSHFFGAFPGYGVWEYDPKVGWFQLTGADARLLAGA